MEKWQDPETIALWIAIAIALVFTILLFVVKIMHAGYKRMTEANLREARIKLEHQKKLLETNLKAQESERMRIAADLHDSLIGRLTVIRMKHQTGFSPDEIDTMLAGSIDEARRISHDLTPPLIEHTPIEELIAEILTPWNKQYTITYNTNISNAKQLPVDNKIQLIRIIQELITNINKHAKAKTITVNLRYTQACFALLVSDDGIGYDSSKAKKGLGLNSLELRMQYLNAVCKTKSAINNGTKTILYISQPLKNYS